MVVCSRQSLVSGILSGGTMRADLVSGLVTHLLEVLGKNKVPGIRETGMPAPTTTSCGGSRAYPDG